MLKAAEDGEATAKADPPPPGQPTDDKKQKVTEQKISTRRPGRGIVSSPFVTNK